MESIPDDVRRFVLTSIPSVPYLEAALLFHDAPPVERSAAEVARSLYMNERAATDLLEALVAAGLLATSDGGAGCYRYAPADDALNEALGRLAAVYASNLVGVTNLIHDATQKSAQRFADAFKLRKDR
jgi:hypothetical protein